MAAATGLGAKSGPEREHWKETATSQWRSHMNLDAQTEASRIERAKGA
jgi:hypothetical protein